jgi:hypothetical protein
MVRIARDMNPLTGTFSAARQHRSSGWRDMATRAKRPTSRKKAAKRTVIAPRGDKRYIRRDSRGRIKESVEVGRSLAADRRTHAKKKAPKGQKDHGD